MPVVTARSAQIDEGFKPLTRTRSDLNRLGTAARIVLGAISATIAMTVVWHTVSFVMLHHPELPVFDGWAPWTSLREVVEGRTSPLYALVAPHNEHRIVLVRLLFIADLLLDGGRDYIAISLAVGAQALQAWIWLALLRRTAVDRPTVFLVGGIVVAMLLTLRQGDNFVSGFQAQFTGVFALNVVATWALSKPMAAKVGTAGRRSGVGAGFAFLLALPFTMANGLLAGPSCALAGLLTRSPDGRRVACAALTTTAISVVLDRSLPLAEPAARMLAFTPAAALHAAAYLGGMVTSGRLPWAVAAGLLGLMSAGAAGVAVVRNGFRGRADFVAFEALLFTVGSAFATAVGRIGAGLGVEQALSGRYATGSAAFWTASLVFWTVRLQDAAPGRCRRTGKIALVGAVMALITFVVRDQHSYDRVLTDEAAATTRVLRSIEQSETPAAADLSRIGVDLPTAQADIAVMRRIRGRAEQDERQRD